MPQDSTQGHGDQDWTFVQRKGGKKCRNIPQKVVTPELVSEKPLDLLSLSTSLSLVEVEADYERIAKQWRDTPCCERVKSVVEVDLHSHAAVKNAICLGLGSFDPQTGSFDAKRRAHIQLVAFETIVALLEEKSDDKISCIFQDPMFTSVDREFLEQRGHTVVETPRAFHAVDTDSLVFGVHLYHDIQTEALANHIPAMFVGSGLEEWESNLAAKLDLSRIKQVHDTCRRQTFPQDGDNYTFSSTCIYWRRLDEPT